MTISSRPTTATQPASSEPAPDRTINTWGGAAGLLGVLLLLGSVAVVVGLGLPDASEVETLTDFADIRSGRIAEHLLYLGALMLFTVHVFALHRLLRTAHVAAALFATVVAASGLVIMAASSLLHVSTSPLADLYDSPNTPPRDLQMLEYAWHGTQSVFDTMLATGVLLVPIGIALFGLAMRTAPAFGPGLGTLAIGLGTVGLIGATIAVIDPGSMFAAVSVLAIALFNVASGWRTLRLGHETIVDLTDDKPAPVD